MKRNQIGNDIEDAVILEDDDIWVIEYFKNIHDWVIQQANDILLPNETRPKYFLKESYYRSRDKEIIYIQKTQ